MRKAICHTMMLQKPAILNSECCQQAVAASALMKAQSLQAAQGKGSMASQTHLRHSSPASLGPGVSRSFKEVSLGTKPTLSRAAMRVLISSSDSSANWCVLPRFSWLRKRSVSSASSGNKVSPAAQEMACTEMLNGCCSNFLQLQC